MSARCNHIFAFSVGGGCRCGAAMPPIHRVEMETAPNSFAVELVCTACCPEHRTREPLEDRDTIETTAGEQADLFGELHPTP